MSVCDLVFIEIYPNEKTNFETNAGTNIGNNHVLCLLVQCISTHLKKMIFFNDFKIIQLFY